MRNGTHNGAIGGIENMIDFFKKKSVRLVAWCVLVISAGVLIVGGANAEEISGGVVLVSGIVSAVSALIAFIAEKVKE